MRSHANLLKNNNSMAHSANRHSSEETGSIQNNPQRGFEIIKIEGSKC